VVIVRPSELVPSEDAIRQQIVFVIVIVIMIRFAARLSVGPTDDSARVGASRARS
jgi:hypothetical protein